MSRIKILTQAWLWNNPSMFDKPSAPVATARVYRKWCRLKAAACAQNEETETF